MCVKFFEQSFFLLCNHFFLYVPISKLGKSYDHFFLSCDNFVLYVPKFEVGKTHNLLFSHAITIKFMCLSLNFENLV